jgi:hypothetical protein
VLQRGTVLHLLYEIGKRRDDLSRGIGHGFSLNR